MDNSIVIVVVVLLILLIVTGIVFWSKKKKSSPKLQHERYRREMIPQRVGKIQNPQVAYHNSVNAWPTYQPYYW